VEPPLQLIEPLENLQLAEQVFANAGVAPVTAEGADADAKTSRVNRQRVRVTCQHFLAVFLFVDIEFPPKGEALRKGSNWPWRALRMG
jgi:hypothetical protein